MDYGSRCHMSQTWWLVQAMTRWTAARRLMSRCHGKRALRPNPRCFRSPIPNPLRSLARSIWLWHNFRQKCWNTLWTYGIFVDVAFFFCRKPSEIRYFFRPLGGGWIQSSPCLGCQRNFSTRSGCFPQIGGLSNCIIQTASIWTLGRASHTGTS